MLYVNDSRATFLDATLESLGTIDRRAVWIVGGWSQEMSGEAVQSMLRERVHAVVLWRAGGGERGEPA